MLRKREGCDSIFFMMTPEQKNTNRDQAVDKIMSQFNFDTVHQAMVALDWQWVTSHAAGHEVPSLDRIKQTAKSLLLDAWNETSILCHGGFQAERIDDVLVLEFVLARADSHTAHAKS